VSRWRRLTQMMTPPPFRRTPPPSKARDFRPQESSLSSQLSDPLRRLLAAPSISHPDVAPALLAIKNLAASKGPYVIALEIRSRLEATSWSYEDGSPCHKQRGYVLVADFIHVHIRRELAALKSGSGILGPNIFRTYCNELVDSLLRGDRPHRAVEIPVLLIDDVVAEAFDDPRRASKLMNLALQAVESMIENHQRQHQTEPSSEPNTPRPASGKNPTSSSRNSSIRMRNQTLMTYLENLESALRAAALVCVSVDAMDDESSAFDESRRFRFWQELLNRTSDGEYFALTAALQERLGNRIADANPLEAKQQWGEAGQAYERQGDLEQKLEFKKLSFRRFERAAHLFHNAGARARASAVETKMETAT
jgi:hypothetical protein